MVEGRYMMIPPIYKWAAGLLSTLFATALIAIVGLVLQLKEAVAVLATEMRHTQTQVAALTVSMAEYNSSTYKRAEVDYRLQGFFTQLSSLETRVLVLEKECARRNDAK